MAEIVSNITIEAFKPEGRDRLPQTNIHLIHLMMEFCGRGSLRFFRAGGLPDEAVPGFNEYTYDAIRRAYGLPSNIDPREFYMQNQKHATALPEYYNNLLPEVEGLELKDEIALFSDRPSDLFRRLSKPAGQIDPTLAYEVYRHALLIDISSQINARTLNGRLHTRLSDVQQALNETFFEGPEGAGSKRVVESIHDDETNEVVGFPDTLRRIPPTAHLKHINFTVRNIKNGGIVYTGPRKKDDRISILKSIVKARENGGVISVDSGVLDLIGMRVVSMDGRFAPEQLADEVVSVLKTDPRFKIKDIEKDDKTGTDHGQAVGQNFNNRRKIWFEDIPVPVELIFYDLATYLNSRLEVGTRDPKTGLFMGRAHRLFDLRRAEKAASTIFPESIYPAAEDLAAAFINRSKLDARELREMYI